VGEALPSYFFLNFRSKSNSAFPTWELQKGISTRRGNFVFMIFKILFTVFFWLISWLSFLTQILFFGYPAIGLVLAGSQYLINLSLFID